MQNGTNTYVRETEREREKERNKDRGLNRLQWAASAIESGSSTTAN